MNNKDNSHYDNLLIMLGLGFLCLIFYKIGVKALAWSHFHPFLGAFFCAGILIIIPSALVGSFWYWKENRKSQKEKLDLFKKTPDSVYLGREKVTQARIYLPLSGRRQHAQAIGSTCVGKTEFIMLLAVDDMKHKRGFLLMDGKPERDTLNKIIGYLQFHNRLDDFKLFSLASPRVSCTFNPLIGDSVEEVADRVLQAFDIEDEYYKAVQRTVLANILYVFSALKIVPTFRKILEAIGDTTILVNMANATKNRDLAKWASDFSSLSMTEREKRTSGLVSNISPFAYGEYAELFNVEEPDIDFKTILAGNKIVYFQIPALKIPNFGTHTGRFVLQAFANGISFRHSLKKSERKFFSAYLDDFSEYLYEGFLTIINKSRSADVGVLFAHQALGDLDALGDNIANGLKTNSNLKIMMKSVDPDTAEWCSRVVGTKTAAKQTHRVKKGLMGDSQTGDSSLRESETFIIHPQMFKDQMGIGDAVLVVPFKGGTRSVNVKFHKLPDQDDADLPVMLHKVPRDIPERYRMDESKSKKESVSVDEAVTNRKDKI